MTIAGFRSKILFNRKIVLFLMKDILNISVLTLTACNTGKAFPLKCWSPSDDGNHWPKHVKDLFHY
jgi:hypothetical protein